jgi:uncharacterized RDD family membrane protein YckC
MPPTAQTMRTGRASSAEFELDFSVYATWSQRLRAWLIDVCLVFGLLFVPALVVAAVVDGNSPHAGEGEGALIALAFPLVFTAYSTIFHGRGRGQTPGKRVAGIAVRDASTLTRISYGGAFVRALLTAVLWIWIIPGIIDGLWPLRDPNQRALHDKAAGSAVVRLTRTYGGQDDGDL